jgi:beta-galactosidase
MLGIRVSETDSAEPDHSNPIQFADGPGAHGGLTAVGRMIFEVIVPEGAEVVARYGEDFYAGEPAVTLNRRPVGDSPLVEGVEGHAWYIGTQLDHEGLSHIMRSVLARHDLVGPYADLPDIELATRIALSGTTFDFIINHSAEPVEITVHADGQDVLGRRYLAKGERVTLGGTDLIIVRS